VSERVVGKHQTVSECVGSVGVCRECRSVEPRSFAVLNLGASERSVREHRSIGTSSTGASELGASELRRGVSEHVEYQSIGASEHRNVKHWGIRARSLGASEGSRHPSVRVSVLGASVQPWV
jgi:hypothetical protein